MTLAPEALFEASTMSYRLEVAKLEMQLVLYRQKLVEHGIEPPDAEGEELLRMWRDCRAVISTASEFVANLGSAQEFLRDWEP